MAVLDLTGDYEKKPDNAYWEKRNQSIERQTACKCVAQVFEGCGHKMANEGLTEQDFVKAFNLFMKLIRGQ